MSLKEDVSISEEENIKFDETVYLSEEEEEPLPQYDTEKDSVTYEDQVRSFFN